METDFARIVQDTSHRPNSATERPDRMPAASAAAGQDLAELLVDTMLALAAQLHRKPTR